MTSKSAASGEDPDADRFPKPSTAPAPRRLHVLHVCATASDPLAAQVVDYLRDQLDRGWTVTVACPSQGELGFAARDLGAVVRWWRPSEPSARPGTGAWSAGRRLTQALAGVDADIAHLHGGRAGMIGRLVLRHRVPTLYQPHGSAFAGPGVGRTAGRRRLDVLCERLASRWTSQVVCQNRAEADRMMAAGLPPGGPGADHESVAVMRAGVDVTRWRAQGPGDRSSAQARLGCDDDAVVVCIGPLVPRLAHAELVAAWPDVRARVPGARLVLVGDGPERDRLQELAARTAGVTLVGGRGDLPIWMAAADVVVPIGSQAAMTALRAMACARSVVVAGDSGAEGVVVAGTGAVIAAHDRSALVSALQERLAAPGFAEEEGWRGREHVERHHDSAHVARELSRIYPRLVAARRA